MKHTIAGTANPIPCMSPLNLTTTSHPPRQWEAQPMADRVEQDISTLPMP
ncbi:MAG: hypothetical protein ABI318_22470 [Chthoniobacteraceae bacterium]